MDSEGETLERAYHYTKRIASQLREEFPGCIISASRASCVVDPGIHFRVLVLNVPEKDHERVYDRAWEIYAAVCPGSFMPCFMDTVDTTQSAEHYSDLLSATESFEEALEACMNEYAEVLRRLDD